MALVYAAYRSAEEGCVVKKVLDFSLDFLFLGRGMRPESRTPKTALVILSEQASSYGRRRANRHVEKRDLPLLCVLAALREILPGRRDSLALRA